MASNLEKRLVSAIILGGISIMAILRGGMLFQILMIAALLAMLFEWISICKPSAHKKLFLFGIVYISVPMLYWVRFSIENPDELARNVLWCFTMVWSCDIFAYFGGKLLKGPKFAPNISPNKTWSGVIVGSIASIVIGMSYLKSNEMLDNSAIVTCVLMVIASVYGDLLESKVKRILNVKDTGNIIPGHGGVCDRLDSFLLVTYVFMAYSILLK